MTPRRVLLLGFGALAAFDAWLVVALVDVGVASSAIAFALGLVAALAALALLAARPNLARTAVLVALGGHAAQRAWFAAAAEPATLGGLLAWALALALILALVAVARESAHAAVAVAAVAGVAALVLLDTMGRGQSGAAMRQALHVAGFALVALGLRAGAPAAGEDAAPMPERA